MVNVVLVQHTQCVVHIFTVRAKCQLVICDVVRATTLCEPRQARAAPIVLRQQERRPKFSRRSQRSCSIRAVSHVHNSDCSAVRQCVRFKEGMYEEALGCGVGWPPVPGPESQISTFPQAVTIPGIHLSDIFFALLESHTLPHRRASTVVYMAHELECEVLFCLDRSADLKAKCNALDECGRQV